MKVVVALLCLQGILVYPYIDDWLLVSDSPSTLLSDVHFTLSLLSRLGLQVNLSKSQRSLVQRLLFIGGDIDTSLCKVFLPNTRASTIQALVENFFRTPTQSARCIMCLLGLIAATVFMVPWAQLCMRCLQLWFLKKIPDPSPFSQPTSHCASSHAQLPAVVEQSTKPAHRRPFSDSQSSVLSFHGCLSLVLGSQDRDPPSSRSLVFERSVSSHQLSGTSRYFQRSLVLPACSCEQLHTHYVRQCSNCLLHQSARGHEVLQALQSCHCPMGLVPRAPHNFKDCTHSWGGKSICRCSQPFLGDGHRLVSQL